MAERAVPVYIYITSTRGAVHVMAGQTIKYFPWICKRSSSQITHYSSVKKMVPVGYGLGFNRELIRVFVT
jgi:hypothetical protein